jgi:hypothetical protein
MKNSKYLVLQYYLVRGDVVRRREKNTTTAAMERVGAHYS